MQRSVAAKELLYEMDDLAPLNKDQDGRGGQHAKLRGYRNIPSNGYRLKFVRREKRAVKLLLVFADLKVAHVSSIVYKILMTGRGKISDCLRFCERVGFLRIKRF